MCWGAVVVVVVGSVAAADVVGVLLVAGAVLAGTVTVVCGAACAVDVVATVSPTVVSGTWMDEQAAAINSGKSQKGRTPRMWRVVAALLQRPTSESRTRSKDLLLELCSYLTAADRPTASPYRLPAA